MKQSMLSHLFVSLNKPLFILAVGLSLVATGLGLLLPQVIGQLLDEAVLVNMMSQPYKLVQMLLFFLVVYGLRALSTYLVGTSGSQAVNRLQKRLHQQLLRAKVPVLDRYVAGDLTSRLTSDVSVVLRFITMIVPNVLLHLVVILGSIYFLWQISPMMTAMSLTFFPILMVLMLPLNRRLEGCYASYQTTLGDLSGSLGHKYRQSRLIKTFCGEKVESFQVGQAFDRLTVLFNQIIGWTAVEQTLVNGLVMGGILLLLIFAGREVVAGRLNISQLTTFVLYLTQLVEPLAELVQSTADIAEFTSVSKRLRELLDLPSEDNQASVELSDTSVCFEDVQFAYENDNVLNGLSFHLPTGKHLAIVGPSGSGKSTIFSLLLSFQQAQEGKILVGKTDISQLSPSQLRHVISYMPQDNSLFRGTLRENLFYGKNAQVSEERLWEVLEALELSQVIADLEHGLDTSLSDSGVGLSEGQKQRFSVARALLQDASIYLMDEVTASLDKTTEAIMTKAIDRLTAGKTRLTIAHRLNTITAADYVLVLDKSGRPSHFGKPNEVLVTGQLVAPKVA